MRVKALRWMSRRLRTGSAPARPRLAPLVALIKGSMLLAGARIHGDDTYSAGSRA